MKSILRRIGGFLIIISSVGIAACGGGGNDNNGSSPPPPSPPPPPPVTLELTQVFENVNLLSPVGMYQPPNDNSRWYAVEQSGRIWAFDNDPNVSSQDEFLDVTGLVQSGGEAGLLGMAFHPDYGNGNFDVFISYTRSGAPLESVISRFSSNNGGDTLSLATEEIIMTIAQDESNHNGGRIAFGPDGYLYAGWGDGGGGGDPLGRGQRTTNLLGSFTRIDIDGLAPYEIPPTNPAAGGFPACIGGFSPVALDCPEIFAWGFRNPWAWSFDSQTGTLWAGDVGQARYEEIDRVEINTNYGWDAREGAHCFEPLNGCDTNNQDPVTEYDRASGGSVTGGYVYRGTAVTTLADQYVFGEFVSGRVFAVPESAAIGSDFTELEDTDYSISSFGEDVVTRELYLMDYNTGDIYQFTEQ